jgi:AGCS family alanine or glycine:cation symporter
VIGFSDAMIFMMSIANVIGLYILAKVLRDEVQRHRAKVRSGEFARVK